MESGLGASVTKASKTSQLIFAGAYPNAWRAAKLAEEQKPSKIAETARTTRTRYYLFAQVRTARADRRPRVTKDRPVPQPDRQKTAAQQEGIRPRRARRDHRRLRPPTDL